MIIFSNLGYPVRFTRDSNLLRQIVLAPLGYLLYTLRQISNEGFHIKEPLILP